MTLALMAFAAEAQAVKISDITHLQGTRVNRLTGMGLVVGLNGTGDGGRYVPAMRPLMQLYRRFANPVGTLDEFSNVKNVAIVTIEVALPKHGAREGESLDVMVSSIGAAKSLEGGRLLMTPLVGPHPDDPRVMAMAGGPLSIDNPDVPTSARIMQGATLEEDWLHTYMVAGRELPVQIRNRAWVRPDEPYVTFVVGEPHAQWSIADTIAETINREESAPEVARGNVQDQIAMAIDPRTILIRVPRHELANPAPFLARLESLQLFMPSTEARVTIDRNSGSIVITGDVEIYPAVISYKGLSITTVTPEPEPTEEMPRVEERDWIKMDPKRRGGTSLEELVEALNQLRVPAEDRIAIIEQLHRIGKLHATLIVEQ